VGSEYGSPFTCVDFSARILAALVRFSRNAFLP